MECPIAASLTDPCGMSGATLAESPGDKRTSRYSLNDVQEKSTPQLSLKPTVLRLARSRLCNGAGPCPQLPVTSVVMP